MLYPTVRGLRKLGSKKVRRLPRVIRRFIFRCIGARPPLASDFADALKNSRNSVGGGGGQISRAVGTPTGGAASYAKIPSFEKRKNPRVLLRFPFEVHVDATTSTAQRFRNSFGSHVKPGLAILAPKALKQFPELQMTLHEIIDQSASSLGVQATSSYPATQEVNCIRPAGRAAPWRPAGPACRSLR